MHFEKSLKRSTYPPWKDQYIDYPKLKALLRDEGSETGSADGTQADDEWTEQDEGAFVEELVNVQLEKVHAFQSNTIQRLRDRTSQCEAKLDPIVVASKNGDEAEDGHEEQGSTTASKAADGGQQTLDEVLKELNVITKAMNELEKFSRINYTGFLKATKKHDRKRGHAYRVRPLMSVRLAALPFNKEDYSPLLFRLSTMYGFIRQNSQGKEQRASFSESQTGSDEFTSYKYWVHPDNLLELKTIILRRLPVLVYNPQSSRIADGVQKDPTITSIYFDNPSFQLYNAKVDHKISASSLRLRWYGQLADNPEVYCEKKTVNEDDTSREQKFTTKVKYVQRYLDGEYKMDKEIQKLRTRVGEGSDQVKQLETNVNDIQDFVKSNDLRPILRANYTRTAFQIPGDNRVRVTLDTELALIREDALDPEQPCRNPQTWHREDIDDPQLEYPFVKVSKSDINRFPHALLEVRVRGNKKYEWTSDLMNSHLVKPAPRFSKFVHGVAQLFDDYVNSFPFWLHEVDTEIRKDPHDAFEEEQARKQKVADDEFAVGSLLKPSFGSPSRSSKPDVTSLVGSPDSARNKIRAQPKRATSEMTKASAQPKSSLRQTVAEENSDEDTTEVRDSRGLRSFLPSMSKFARSRRQGQVRLPPGVQEPSFWIKDEGHVKVEAKVWMANQRTFIKWQHVGILLSSLSLGLFNAAAADNQVAKTLGIVYTVIGILTALWGYGIYMWRSDLIRKRSGRDFDNVIGPVVVCSSLIVALILNFVFKFRAIQESRDASTNSGKFTSLDEL